MQYVPGQYPWLGVAKRKRIAAARLEQRAVQLRAEADDAEARGRQEVEAVAS
jgi:hypothetical protein